VDFGGGPPCIGGDKINTLPKDFYSRHARRYAQVSHEFIQSVYTNVSHPGLTGDLALMARLKELVPSGARGLDAGCGAGARDVYFYRRDGYDMIGIDVVEENIALARTLHPEIADSVAVADLAEPLVYPDASFDFVICNAVIQHIPPERVLGFTLPEFARVLRVGGVLQLMHKVGSGSMTIFDRDYGVERSFRLYEPEELVARLASLGLDMVPQAEGGLGGLMYFTDPKPVDHCVFHARKVR
jgi:SAM-dependent methyltransferase